MNIKEFSNEFDLLYNNIMSNAAPGLNEYEKSVLLTKAQEDLVIGVYSGRNIFGVSFERIEEVRRYLSNLVRTHKSTDKITTEFGIDDLSVFFKLPDDLWFITYESAILEDSKLKCGISKASIVPTTQDDYFKIKDNPFKGPNSERVLRLDTEDNLIELISKYDINYYFVRYLRRPSPIILSDLSEWGVTINGISTVSECELDTAIHNQILQAAVELAKGIFTGSVQAG